MEVSGQLHSLTALPAGKEPLVPTGKEAGWATKTVWGEKVPVHAGTRTPDHPAHSPALCYWAIQAPNKSFNRTIFVMSVDMAFDGSTLIRKNMFIHVTFCQCVSSRLEQTEDDSSWSLLGCDAVLCYGRMPTFRRSMLPVSSGWSEVGGSMKLWNFGILTQHHTASQPRRSRLEISPPWKLQNSQIADELQYNFNMAILPFFASITNLST
jgi:hypothetical protein